MRPLGDQVGNRDGRRTSPVPVTSLYLSFPGLLVGSLVEGLLSKQHSRGSFEIEACSLRLIAQNIAKLMPILSIRMISQVLYVKRLHCTQIVADPASKNPDGFFRGQVCGVPAPGHHDATRGSLVLRGFVRGKVTSRRFPAVL